MTTKNMQNNYKHTENINEIQNDQRDTIGLQKDAKQAQKDAK